MALNITTLKTSFISKLNSLSFDENTTDDQAKEAYAQVISEWVIDAIQSATITIPSATIVTVGSATTQTQSTPAVINNGLS